MMDFTLGEIAAAVGGELVDGADPAAMVTGSVEFDSRNVTEGGLFLCLPGLRVDGHDFAEIAQAQGAVAVIEAHRTGVPGILVPPVTDGAADTHAYVLAGDSTGEGAAVLTALAALARYNTDTAVQRAGLTVIGITGSAGKTSTKDMVASVVSRAGTTVAPPGSFNNELGHPYTALKASADTRFLVLELSARSVGNIAHLAEVAPPQIGVELNVGTAHLGEFGSQEVIAAAKGELVEALPASGVAILNADDPRVAAMAERTPAHVIRYGTEGGDTGSRDVYATDIHLDEMARPNFLLHIGEETPEPVQLAVFGLHQVHNALAAAAVGHAVGMSSSEIARGLRDHVAVSSFRMDVQTRADSVTIINDSYNANPDSMRAGLDALAYTTSGRSGARSWAVLGTMGELGADAQQAHADLGGQVADRHIDYLVAVGTNASVRALADAAKRRGVAVTTVNTAAAAADYVSAHLHPGDVVLVKASNADHLWTVAQHLVEEGTHQS
ncbi:MAG: UDP-N-acetylmuramoyl-tripeptide--D-alanyl-D-alanine ligase [Corynebacterium sp.]|nr:UDP-N-acetylmuramoyl-tripeptide--D-alanyl-D-alanine ligase [Corynebacterium sp.]